MDIGESLFFGLALIVLAIFALDMVKPADAGLMGREEYKEASISGSEYVVDTETSATHLYDIK